MTEKERIIKNLAYGLVGLAFMSLYLGNQLITLISIAGILVCVLALSK